MFSVLTHLVDFYIKFTLRQWTGRVDRAHIIFLTTTAAGYRAQRGSCPPATPLVPPVRSRRNRSRQFALIRACVNCLSKLETTLDILSYTVYGDACTGAGLWDHSPVLPMCLVDKHTRRHQSAATNRLVVPSFALETIGSSDFR